MKKYAFLTMWLIGLLVPMTIASKSVDFQVNTVLFDNQKIAITVDVLKLTQPQITKFMITKEVAEGIRKRSYTGSKVDIYLSAYPPEHGLWPLMVDGRPIIDRVVRYQTEAINIESKIFMQSHYKELDNIYDNMGFNPVRYTNQIRADTNNTVSDKNSPGRVSDIQDLKKVVLLNAVSG